MEALGGLARDFDELGRVGALFAEDFGLDAEFTGLPKQRAGLEVVAAGEDNVGVQLLDLREIGLVVLLREGVGLLADDLQIGSVLRGVLLEAGHERAAEVVVAGEQGDRLRAQQLVRGVPGGLPLDEAEEAVPEAEVAGRGHVRVNGVRRHQRDLLLLEDGGHRAGGKAVRARHEGRYLVLLDKLVGEGDRFLGVGPVVVVHQLDLFAEHAAVLVHLVHGYLDGVEGARAVRRRRSSQGHEKPHLDRLRAEGQGRNQ
ncbi:MAG: hypothetical protein BWY99_02584 [Synergistetes bacterium ADurb.BinA166]|nr:MAG: hypothetical protein BWY99_02584 [Synergistetes bacterium ADurb.BinA166]